MNSSQFADQLALLIAEARIAGLDDEELTDLLDDAANMLEGGMPNGQLALETRYWSVCRVSLPTFFHPYSMVYEAGGIPRRPLAAWMIDQCHSRLSYLAGFPKN